MILLILILTLIALAQWIVILGILSASKREKKLLAAERREMKHRLTTCYACTTGASVTSFSNESARSFCPYHKAHRALITDLEQMTGIDQKKPVSYETALTVDKIVAKHYPQDTVKNLSDGFDYFSEKYSIANGYGIIDYYEG